MPTYVVLLRGVNVGTAKRVPMTEFKTALLEIGCTRVTTLLNSGNAVVDHPKVSTRTLAARIAAALGQRFGFDVPVVVQSKDELRRVVAGRRLTIAEGDESKLLVVFGQTNNAIDALTALGSSLAEVVAAPERLQVTEYAAYLYCPRGILKSKAAAQLLGKGGTSVTTRNWATVSKLAALVEATAP